MYQKYDLSDQLEYQIYASRRISMRNSTIIGYLYLLPVILLTINIVLLQDLIFVISNIVGIIIFFIIYFSSVNVKSDKFKKQMKKAFPYIFNEIDQTIEIENEDIIIRKKNAENKYYINEIKEIINVPKYYFLILNDISAIVIKKECMDKKMSEFVKELIKKLP